METPTTETQGEQPSVTEAAEVVSEQLATSDSQSDAKTLEDLDSQGLDALLNELERRGNQPQAPDAQAAPQPTPQAATPEETPAPQQTAEEAQQSQQPDATQAPVKEGPLRRIPLGGVPEDQRTLIADATNLIRDGKAATLPEALTMLGHAPQAAATTEPETTQTPTQQQPAQQEQTPTSSTEIKAQIVALREQRKTARAEFDTEGELAITDQIEDAQANLFRAEQAEREAATQNRSWEADHETACDRVEAKYQQLEDPDSTFSQALADKVDAAKARKDPAMADPNFIEKFADDVAKMLGLTSPPPPAPKAAALPAKGQAVAPGHQTASRPSKSEAETMIHQADDDALDNAIREIERRKLTAST